MKHRKRIPRRTEIREAKLEARHHYLHPRKLTPDELREAAQALKEFTSYRDEAEDPSCNLGPDD